MIYIHMYIYVYIYTCFNNLAVLIISSYTVSREKSHVNVAVHLWNSRCSQVMGFKVVSLLAFYTVCVLFYFFFTSRGTGFLF